MELLITLFALGFSCATLVVVIINAIAVNKECDRIEKNLK